MEELLSRENIDEAVKEVLNEDSGIALFNKQQQEDSNKKALQKNEKQQQEGFKLLVVRVNTEEI